jgi:hypothetical protein
LKLTTGAELLPAGWRALAWLTIRQGRWILLGSALGCMIAGPFVNLAPVLLYPIATLLVGLVCGLAVFVPEQSGRQQVFLGAQRFPPGRIWSVKVGLWALAAVLLTAALFGTAAGTAIMKDAQALNYKGKGVIGSNNGGDSPPATLVCFCAFG